MKLRKQSLLITIILRKALIFCFWFYNFNTVWELFFYFISQLTSVHGVHVYSKDYLKILKYCNTVCDLSYAAIFFGISGVLWGQHLGCRWVNLFLQNDLKNLWTYTSFCLVFGEERVWWQALQGFLFKFYSDQANNVCWASKFFIVWVSWVWLVTDWWIIYYKQQLP